ncbi:alpha/beta hydrolase [Bifidobacterium sp. ESL0745]|uniref:alpha/beta hydrolase n=1 Tax=Bifidobacterium sp. ESL0745 TaxID=2983226 RepID=UPI0023F8CC1E|nr:alpha/beta hydrolase [Bifidobacterium sp. ESL0745]MDF7665235.1 alpha/beta hydrolase [Bifidobacterium sp. ESL0745]
MFESHYLDTPYGDFHYCICNTHEAQRTMVAFTCMGINSAEYDFYGLANAISPTTRLILVDLLGSGKSGQPKNAERNLENIRAEIAGFLNGLHLDRYYLCTHSFTAIYLLKCLSVPSIRSSVTGFIAIDPSIPAMMCSHTDDFTSNLEEAEANRKRHASGMAIAMPDADINPLLPDTARKDCFELYCNLSGNPSEISELHEATATAEKTQNLKLDDDIPSLSFLSTLNLPHFLEFGNPYFNSNQKSAEVVLQGHHFLHWLHPDMMGRIINGFIDETAAVESEESDN